MPTVVNAAQLRERALLERGSDGASETESGVWSQALCSQE